MGPQAAGRAAGRAGPQAAGRAGPGRAAVTMTTAEQNAIAAAYQWFVVNRECEQASVLYRLLVRSFGEPRSKKGK